MALAGLPLPSWCAVGGIPAGLGGLGGLVYLDLADNRLTGGLEPFASALAQNASTKPLM